MQRGYTNKLRLPQEYPQLLQENCIHYKRKSPPQGHTEDHCSHCLQSTLLESLHSFLWVHLQTTSDDSWTCTSICNSHTSRPVSLLYLHILQKPQMYQVQMWQTILSHRLALPPVYFSHVFFPCFLLFPFFLPTRNNLDIWESSFTLLSYSRPHAKNSHWVAPILLSFLKNSNLSSLFHSY